MSFLSFLQETFRLYSTSPEWKTHSSTTKERTKWTLIKGMKIQAFPMFPLLRLKKNWAVVLGALPLVVSSSTVANTYSLTVCIFLSPPRQVKWVAGGLVGVLPMSSVSSVALGVTLVTAMASWWCDSSWWRHRDGRGYRTDAGEAGGTREGMTHQHQGGVRITVPAFLVENNLPPRTEVGNVFKWCFLIHKPQLSITAHYLSWLGQIFGLFKGKAWCLWPWDPSTHRGTQHPSSHQLFLSEPSSGIKVFLFS